MNDVHTLLKRRRAIFIVSDHSDLVRDQGAIGTPACGAKGCPDITPIFTSHAEQKQVFEWLFGPLSHPLKFGQVAWIARAVQVNEFSISRLSRRAMLVRQNLLQGGTISLKGPADLFCEPFANGQTDLVVEAGMKPYDYLAHAVVVAGAGGVISDWRGAPLTLASPGSVLAAGDKRVHAAALALLDEV